MNELNQTREEIIREMSTAVLKTIHETIVGYGADPRVNALVAGGLETVLLRLDKVTPGFAKTFKQLLDNNPAFGSKH